MISDLLSEARVDLLAARSEKRVRALLAALYNGIVQYEQHQGNFYGDDYIKERLRFVKWYLDLGRQHNCTIKEKVKQIISVMEGLRIELDCGGVFK